MHVGKEALFTAGCNLLLDPSALDRSWSFDVPNIRYHKKPAYKMALAIFCTKFCNGMDCGLWPFPVKKSVYVQWGALTNTAFSESQITSLFTSKFKKKKKGKHENELSHYEPDDSC